MHLHGTKTKIYIEAKKSKLQTWIRNNYDISCVKLSLSGYIPIFSQPIWFSMNLDKKKPIAMISRKFVYRNITIFFFDSPKQKQKKKISLFFLWDFIHADFLTYDTLVICLILSNAWKKKVSTDQGRGRVVRKIPHLVPLDYSVHHDFRVKNSFFCQARLNWGTSI